MIGISLIETFIPRGRMTFEEMARQSGISPEGLLDEIGVETKAVLGESETIMNLAIGAARRLVQNAGVNPSEIGFILFCSCGPFEKSFWSPAAKIQKEIGAVHAFSFDVLNGCNSGNLGLHLATNLLKANPAQSVAIVVVADALSQLVDYTDPSQSCIYNFGDAASALLLRRGETRNQILSFAASTNATFADHMRIETGSTKIAMNTDEEEDRALSAEYRLRYIATIHDALRGAGLEVSQVDHLFMNQGDHRLIRRLTEALCLPAEKIFQSYRDFGHLGGTDIFFGLKARLDEGLIRPGHISVLASSAIGFSWGATVIRA
jgi:3-oxoacyl-[acyl-carrier-protein] synthase-3